MPSKKTETTTFRLEKDILDDLRKTAETDKITLNSLINQIFSQFVKWDSRAPKAGLVPLPKVLLVKIMDKLTNDQIIQIAKYMVDKEIKDIILVLRREHNIITFLDVVESWAKTSDFPFEHEEKNDMHKYVISHDMGKKWSLYFGEVFKRMFEQLEITKAEFDITDKTLLFTIYEQIKIRS